MRILSALFLIFVINSYKGNNKEKAFETYADSIVVNQKSHANPKISIVAGYDSINSVKELFKRFKGKPLFVDLWATWCEPCIEEFSFSDSLYEFLTKKGCEMLYISIDKKEADIDWKAMIDRHALYGNHMRANKRLMDEITTLIWGAKDVYSIPHYLFFDKNKNLINKECLPPSAGIKLYHEIEAGLIDLTSTNR